MKQIITLGSVRLAACLVVAAGLMACGSRDDASTKEASDSAVGSPAPSRSAIANETTDASPHAPRIVVLGDSLTAGLGLQPEDAYPAVLQRRLDDKGLPFHVINAGNSGDTSAAGLSRLDLALEGDVRILVVALGANDGLRGLPVAQLKSNLSRIIERAQERSITVILAGMEAPPNWGDDYTRAFHEVYPALADQYHVALVPFLLEGVAGIDRLNQRDGIHPTAEGDRIVAESVWKVLEPAVAAQGAAERRTGAPKS